MKDKRLIQVCSNCGTSCCDQGIFTCGDMSKRELKPAYKLSEGFRLEHESYYSEENILKCYGDKAPFGYEEDKQKYFYYRRG